LDEKIDGHPIINYVLRHFANRLLAIPASLQSGAISGALQSAWSI
jgi:hypothetical protein